jgi:hypothetical protein
LENNKTGARAALKVPCPLARGSIKKANDSFGRFTTVCGVSQATQFGQS